MFRVTHPFHPLFGREFVLVTYRLNWGEQRVYFRDEAGELTALPASWTNVFPDDPFVSISARRSAFRCQDLLELAELLERVQDASRKEGNVGASDV